MKTMLSLIGIIGAFLMLGSVGGLESETLSIAASIGYLLLSSLLIAISYFGIKLYDMKLRRARIMKSLRAKQYAAYKELVSNSNRNSIEMNSSSYESLPITSA